MRPRVDVLLPADRLDEPRAVLVGRASRRRPARPKALTRAQRRRLLRQAMASCRGIMEALDTIGAALNPSNRARRAGLQ